MYPALGVHYEISFETAMSLQLQLRVALKITDMHAALSSFILQRKTVEHTCNEEAIA